MSVLVLGKLASHEVFCTRHGLHNQRLHTLSDILIVNLEEAVLQSAAAGGVKVVPYSIHAFGNCL